VRALALALLAATATGCADAPRPGPPPRPSGGGSGGAACVGDDCLAPPEACAEAAPGCPCDTEGEHLTCGRVEIQIANQTMCGTGDSVCSEGLWGPCVISSTGPIGPPPGPRPPGGVHAYALGKPTPCADNPCDPSCRDFIDTPIGEGNVATGIAEAPGGLTLVPVGPPPAVFVTGTFTRDYDASGVCPPGSTPVWGLWSWSTKTPSDSYVAFAVRTAKTAAGLASAPIDALQFSSAPGPAALAGQATKAQVGPPDTTKGAAIVDTTLVSRGRLRGLPFLRVVARLTPSSDGHSAPLLKAWDLQMSCAPSE
jgi:hypothetical protein